MLKKKLTQVIAVATIATFSVAIVAGCGDAADDDPPPEKKPAEKTDVNKDGKIDENDEPGKAGAPKGAELGGDAPTGAGKGD